VAAGSAPASFLDDCVVAIRALDTTALEVLLKRAATVMINPLDHKNMGGGSPLRDPDFVIGFKALLDPPQSEKFTAAMTQRQTDAPPTPMPYPAWTKATLPACPRWNWRNSTVPCR